MPNVVFAPRNNTLSDLALIIDSLKGAQEMKNLDHQRMMDIYEHTGDPEYYRQAVGMERGLFDMLFNTDINKKYNQIGQDIEKANNLTSLMQQINTKKDEKYNILEQMMNIANYVNKQGLNDLVKKIQTTTVKQGLGDAVVYQTPFSTKQLNDGFDKQELEGVKKYLEEAGLKDKVIIKADKNKHKLNIKDGNIVFKGTDGDVELIPKINYANVDAVKDYLKNNDIGKYYDIVEQDGKYILRKKSNTEIQKILQKDIKSATDKATADLRKQYDDYSAAIKNFNNTLLENPQLIPLLPGANREAAMLMYRDLLVQKYKAEGRDESTAYQLANEAATQVVSPSYNSATRTEYPGLKNIPQYPNKYLGGTGKGKKNIMLYLGSSGHLLDEDTASIINDAYASVIAGGGPMLGLLGTNPSPEKLAENNKITKDAIREAIKILRNGKGVSAGDAAKMLESEINKKLGKIGKRVEIFQTTKENIFDSIGEWNIKLVDRNDYKKKAGGDATTLYLKRVLGK